MFKKLLLLITGIIISVLSFSQQNYLPGYIIQNNGDTVTGFIDYRNWSLNPDLIEFRKTSDSGATKYKPDDIKEFKVKDEIYVSGFVEIENSLLEESKLLYDPKLNITTDTVFLQTLLNGEKSLYYHRNNTGRPNFYVKKDDEFELLVYKKYLIRKGTTSYVHERKDYVGQLNLYLLDCPNIQTMIARTSYSQKDLIRLFQNYYEFFSLDMGFQRQHERVKLEFGVLAGSSSTKLSFYISYPGEGLDYLENTDFKPSTNITGGLFLDILIPRNFRKLSLNNELIFSMYNTDGQYDYIDYSNVHKHYTTEFKYSYLKINNLLRYKFPVGNFSFFCNAGVSNGIRLSEEQYVKKEFTTTYSGTSVYEGTPLTQTSDYEFGFIAGAGIKTNRLSFEARLESASGMITLTSVDASTKRVYFILGYRIK